MRRLAMLGSVLLTFGLAGCTGDQAPSPPVAAAGQQTAALGWSERADDSDKTLIFGVDELRVTDGGWEADVSIANHTDTRFEIPAASDSSERAFGLMLFGDGTTETLNDLVQRGTPPALRGAHVTQPPTPGVLTPGATWRGTISAPGALAVGAWVRVSFGPLTAVDDPPDGIPKDTFTWITDHAYELR